MNPYEAKQEAKRERLLDAAERAKDEAAAEFDRAHRTLAVIPPGQPVLVDHHSEKRHRRDLAKSDAAMRRGFEAQQRAADLAHRAASVGTGGVSSDDPDAPAKLSDKVGELKAEREAMKAANAVYTQAWRIATTAGSTSAEAKAAGWSALVDAGHMTAEQAAGRFRGVDGGAPFQPYAFKNIGARIRDAEKRAEKLTAQQDLAAKVEAGEIEAPAPITGDGWEIVDDVASNRVRIRFDGKPSEDIRARLKSHGFRWAPTEGVWQRQRGSGAMWAAQNAMGMK